MKLIKCPNNHYYDADIYVSCPFCGAESNGDEDLTRPMDPLTPVGISNGFGGSEPPTQKNPHQPSFTPIPVTPMPPIPQPPVGNPAVNGVSNQGNPTEPWYKDDKNEDPVVGWLVCTRGTHKGESFELRTGRNFIGRNADMDIALTGEDSISRERHAVVVFDPKSSQFLAQSGGARELFYLNGEVVLDTVELKAYDVLSVGNVDLLIIPLCTKLFSWDMFREDLQNHQ